MKTDNQLKQRDAVSDTPRTDTVAFGTDDESLNRLFGIRELPRYVAPADFARQLERELAAVTTKRDALLAEKANPSTTLDDTLEIDQLRAELADVRAAKSDNLIKAVEDLTKFSDLLQDCLVLFTEIAQQDDSGKYEISQRLRKQLDTLSLQIKTTT